uniref:Helicase C-terminal domain-containing protein n=1 Tax=Globodera rostochiensis TaxID=31243 RepID=A0A914I920_GLORO
MLFSATMTDQVEDLANLSLNKPVKLFINENTETAMNLHQEFIRIRQDRENEREAYAAALITRNFPDRCILFVRTKRDCERMHILLALLGIKVGRLHGGRTQLQRIESLHAFKKQENVEVLCATDLAARGLDIEGVTTIINMHMPSTLQHYIHRVGRTARAGKAGRSISFIGEQDRKLLKEITKVNQNSNSFPLMLRKIEPEVVDAYNKRICELEPSVKKLNEDEQIEKQLLIVENSLKKAEIQMKSLDTKVAPLELNSRKWIGGREVEQSKYGKRKQRIRSQGRRREAKKGQRPDLGRIAPKQALKQQQKQGAAKKKSSFTAEIANISCQAVKRVRHGPDDIAFKRAKREKQKDGVIRKADKSKAKLRALSHSNRN